MRASYARHAPRAACPLGYAHGGTCGTALPRSAVEARLLADLSVWFFGSGAAAGAPDERSVDGTGTPFMSDTSI